MARKKKCSKCKQFLSVTKFGKNRSKRDNLSTECKICKSANDAQYYKKNTAAICKQVSKYRQENWAKAYQATRKWCEENAAYNREYKRLWSRKRRAEDLQHKLRDILRCRLNHALKGRFKGGSAVRDLGCSISFLIEYLANKFLPSMTWKNHGKWEIDHIKPLSKFDLSDPAQVKIACHYTNLQPLWKKDNNKKGARYDDKKEEV